MRRTANGTTVRCSSDRGGFALMVVLLVLLALPILRLTPVLKRPAGELHVLDAALALLLQHRPRRGQLSLLKPPHTGSNYLLDEMGFRLARKHALKLRRIALGAGFAAPLALTLAALALPAVPATLAALLAAASATAGVLVERWLFFAEAKHTVTLYYGASAA